MLKTFFREPTDRISSVAGGKMCGLVVKIFHDRSVMPEADAVLAIDRAIAAIQHRGPDKVTVQTLPGAIIAHARLSIIDVDAGAQPFFSECGQYVLVYNGEIFNYVELRGELEQEGRSFRTESDTEVLLQAFLHWGEACVERLNGMFSFVVYDTINHFYLAVRDHFGIKPLYYVEGSDGIVFASEVKALLPFLPRIELNEEYLSSYLYTSALDYGRGSLFRGVSQIEAGCLLTSGADGQRAWFDLATTVSRSQPLEKDCLNSRYFSTLQTAIRLRLRSDVPIAFTLSGGMDSSSIFALSSELQCDKSQIAYTLADNSSDSFLRDEMEGAVAVTQLTGGDLRFVEPARKMLLGDVERSIYFQDFPSWSLSHVTYDRVYQRIAADGFKVILEGHGNDEILGGYPPHILSCAESMIRSGNLVHGYRICKAYHQTQNAIYQSSLATPVITFLALLIPGSRRLVQTYKRFRSPLRKLFPRIRHRPKKLEGNKSLSLMQRTLIHLVTTQIIPTVLRTFDRCTMRSSIEMRPPFLDPHVVVESLALPDRDRVDGKLQKGILRSVMQGRLPQSVLMNEVKSGFTDDIHQWAKLFTPRLVIKSYRVEAKEIGLSLTEYERFFSEYIRSNSWENALLINKVASLLIWAKVFSVGANKDV